MTPNLVTILRLALTVVGIVVLFITQSLEWRIAGFVILTVAAIGDLVDGWLARKTGRITSFGIILDPIADKVLILGVMSAFSFLGLYSVIWVLLISLREILVTVIRLVALRTGRVLSAESMGKAKTVSQIVSLGVSYLYLFCRDHLSTVSFWPSWLTDVFGIGNYLFLLIAFILTYWSGWGFFRNLIRTK